LFSRFIDIEGYFIMKQLISKVFGPFLGGRAALGLLLLRVIVGGAFVQHGLPKIQAPFDWGSSMGIPPVFQALAALAEFGGGLALIFGFLTPLGALGVAFTMAVALKIAHLPAGHPWVGSPGKPSYEDVAFYLAAAIAILLTGPGKFSIDSLLFGRSSSSK
jgi:putative oxidoreductase